MAENSEISWTDHTFNPWVGCTKVSPACKFCYAERDFDHRKHFAQWGPNGTRILTSVANWKKPLNWNRDAEKAGIRKRVFCASLADVFEDWPGKFRTHDKKMLAIDCNGELEAVEDCEGVKYGSRVATMNDMRRRLFGLIDATPNLDWLLLTKRPENVRRMWPTWPKWAAPDGSSCRGSGSRYIKNVWLGTSVENQEYAEKRIPELLMCRSLSPVLFLSCEPLLGPVDMRNMAFKYGSQTHIDCLLGTHHDGVGSYPGQKIDWVIAGGESGPNARPSNPNWFRSLRDQCFGAGVPFHFKQWGEWADTGPAKDCEFPFAESIPNGVIGGPCMYRVGKKNAGRELDGRTWDEFPEVMHAAKY